MSGEVTAEVCELFDRNADTYDRVNSLISLGLDARWRAWVARRAVRRRGDNVLDAFAGTGLVGLRAARLGAEVTLADVSTGMLAVAERRVRQAGLGATIVTIDLASESVAAPGGPFDAITVVFGVRYLEDPVAVIRRLATLLRDDGILVVADFIEPDEGVIPWLASVYFFGILPSIASALAGRREIYDRLTATTHRMKGRDRIATIVADAGLDVIEARMMGFGLVAGVVATARGRIPIRGSKRR